MACKGICSRYKARLITGIGRYATGQKRCQPCGIFINYEGLSCPCCGSKLRTRPQGTKYKNKFRMTQKTDEFLDSGGKGSQRQARILTTYGQ